MEENQDSCHEAEQQADRLSVLPEGLIHDIMSLLDVYGIARLSSVSSRFRALCLSSPVLKIGYRDNIRARLDEYIKYVAKLMSLRPSTSPMTKVEIYWSLHGSEFFEKSIVSGWITDAVRCTVRELKLILWGTSFSFSSHSFGSQTSKKIEIDLNSLCYGDSHRLVLPLSSINCLPFLECLALSHLHVKAGSLASFISCLCRLKSLTLEEVFEVDHLVITSSSLSELFIKRFSNEKLNGKADISISADHLETLSITLLGCLQPTTSLVVAAPNLISLHLDVPSMTSCRFRESPLSLKDAAIRFSDFMKEALIQQVMLTVVHAKQLELLKSLSLVLLRKFCSMPHKFDKVSQLTIQKPGSENIFSDRVILETISFLKKFPNLRHLHVRKDRMPSKNFSSWDDSSIMDEKAPWESMELEVFKGLKTLRHEFDGTPNEIQFIEYIVKNAEALEKCIILYPRHWDRIFGLLTSLRGIRMQSSSDGCVATMAYEGFIQ